MSQCLRVLTAVVAALFVASCQTSTRANKSAAPTPVDITTTVADTEGVIPRFTRDIWPLVNASNNAPPDQLSQNAIGLPKVISHDISMEVRAQVERGIESLGTVREADQTHGPIRRDRKVGLTLADTALTAFDSPKATLQICYTYVANTYETINDPPVKNPAASEATVELRKTDNWYLYAITNDHVVPGCSASSKA